MPHFHDPYRPTAAQGLDGGSDESEQSAPQESVPSGTTKEVLEWVGDDKERARLALEKEQANDKPRKGLVEELQAILEDDDEE